MIKIGQCKTWIYDEKMEEIGGFDGWIRCKACILFVGILKEVSKRKERS